MNTKHETLGVVSWYNGEKGYGVLTTPYDNKEYFIHVSALHTLPKRIISEGDVILFIPAFDSERKREIATKIRFHNTASDICNVIEEWINEETVIDDYVERIIIHYLRDSYENKNVSFKDSYHALLDVFSNYMKNMGSSVELYLILKNAIEKAFGPSNAVQFSEITEILMIEKVPFILYSLILKNTTSSFVCFKLAAKNPLCLEDAINKAIDIAETPRHLLNELIRYTKSVNDDRVESILDNNKNNITNYNFYKGIVGEDMIIMINKYIFSSLAFNDLKNLIQNGYIYNWDNATLMEMHPDYYKKLKADTYKECTADSIDEIFITDNIDCFSASDLIKIKKYYQLSDGVASMLFLYLVRHYLKKGVSPYYREIMLFQPEMEDFQAWINSNHNFLAENREEEYQKLMIWLYKNNYFQDLDIDFIVYNIDKFDINEAFKFIDHKQVNLMQKESILSALFVYTIGKDPLIRLNDLKDICNHAKELLNDRYTNWIENLCVKLKDEDNFVLWKERISSLYPGSYIQNELLSTEEKGFMIFLNLCHDNLITWEKAASELWNILNTNQTIPNRPAFYKVLYSIKYLVKLDESVKDTIFQKKNDFYNIILWFLSYSESLDFESLCHLFIYFHPKDQVRIIKNLFYMMEYGKIQLNVKMLDSLLRVDADLYGLISAHHPEVPIDVSSEIIIKSLVNISGKGDFSTDKDVLTIVINAAQCNKNENFKIGSYFDKCVGRKLYRSDGYRRVNGRIKQIKDSFFSVTIYPYVEERVYTRGMSYHTESVWNSSFHVAVDAVKNITGRRWNQEKSYWEVPLEEKERLFVIAEEYGFEIEGTRNLHMRRYRVENEGKPVRLDYCEGRPAQKLDEYVGKEFLWCRNSKCFSECVIEHSKEDWQNYTLLDFCRILGIVTDSVDSEGRLVKHGKYLSFSSIINRANTIIEHLYCRECGEMLEPVQISNYYTHLVTHFHCTNASCGKYHERIYISKCFNWKCHGVIDDRDTKKCPNGWNICPECGSCCSNRVAQQRIDNRIEVGIAPAPYLIDFINNNRGHLEKREFYCCKCGGIMKESADKVFECSLCGVKYERKMYDFEGEEKLSLKPN